MIEWIVFLPLLVIQNGPDSQDRFLLQGPELADSVRPRKRLIELEPPGLHLLTFQDRFYARLLRLVQIQRFGEALDMLVQTSPSVHVFGVALRDYAPRRLRCRSEREKYGAEHKAKRSIN